MSEVDLGFILRFIWFEKLSKHRKQSDHLEEFRESTVGSP